MLGKFTSVATRVDPMLTNGKTVPSSIHESTWASSAWQGETASWCRWICWWTSGREKKNWAWKVGYSGYSCSDVSFKSGELQLSEIYNWLPLDATAVFVFVSKAHVTWVVIRMLPLSWILNNLSYDSGTAIDWFQSWCCHIEVYGLVFWSLIKHYEVHMVHSITSIWQVVSILLSSMINSIWTLEVFYFRYQLCRSF